MRKITLLFLALLLPGLFCLVACLGDKPTAPARPPAPTLEQATKALSNLRLGFVPGSNSNDPHVAFSTATLGGALFVTQEGRMVYSLPRESRCLVLTETFLNGWGGNPAAPRGEDMAQAKVSRFLGADPGTWQTDLPTYAALGLGEVYPGVEVRLQARTDGVEKIFRVHPGTDVKVVRIRLDGAQELEVGADGSLLARTELGEVCYTAPVAWQEIAGRRVPVDATYQVGGQVEGEGMEYGFRVGAYDCQADLMIDPLLQSTYLGGTAAEYGHALAIHPATGDVYVAGYTLSTNFPGTAGGAQAANGAGIDAFVARLNAGLTTLTQATYLGGSGTDVGQGIAIHPGTYDVYVTGYTGSGNFPSVAGGAQTANSGGSFDAFASRLNAALTTLTQSTYLGGSGDDYGRSVTIHPGTYDVYVTGETTSTNFPGTAGSAQAANGTGYDAFASRMNAALTTLTQSTYIGGSGDDYGYGIAIHPTTYDVYATGKTDSTDFPTTAGGAQAANGTAFDAFVARLNAGLTTLTQSTYLGGSGNDVASAIAIHPATGDVYVAGYTLSTNFPGTAGGAQAVKSTGTDAFTARLPAALTSFTQNTYLGGTDTDTARAIAVHPTSGNVYVVGETASADFPGTAGGAQAVKSTGTDAFAARLPAALTSFTQNTYLGGTGTDTARAIAVHPTSGNVYVAGYTDSADFPGAAGGAQAAYGTGTDVFVAREDFGDPISSASGTVDPGHRSSGGNCFSSSGL